MWVWCVDSSWPTAALFLIHISFYRIDVTIDQFLVSTTLIFLVTIAGGTFSPFSVLHNWSISLRHGPMWAGT